MKSCSPVPFPPIMIMTQRNCSLPGREWKLWRCSAVLKQKFCAGHSALWASDVTFVHMELGTGKNISFIPFTISFGLNILH